MMYYALEDNLQVKKWKDTGYMCFRANSKRPYILDDPEYEIVKKSDGNTAIERSLVSDRLEAFGIIKRCNEPYSPADALKIQKQFMEYPNYRVRRLDWTITDKCNCNCLHCFHAADNNISRSEFSPEDALALLDDIRDCGILNVRITGGEPMLYPYIREVIQGIYDRGLRLATFITNGTLLTREFLDFVKELHPDTYIMISFDGIGFHDWLRNKKGSEQETLKAIKLCTDAGLKVFINANVNRRNASAMFDSFRMLCSLGITRMRIIRTSESPRWELNKEDYTLTAEEYYDFSYDFAKKYKESGIDIPVTIWQSLYLNGARKTFSCLTVKNEPGCFDRKPRICNALQGKPSIQANGDAVPCAPMGGYFDRYGIRLGNVHEESLQKLLSKGAFADFITMTVEEKLSKNGTCAACKHIKYCQGGCPVLAAASGGGFFDRDPLKCIFFNNGYYDKYCGVLAGWKNLHEI